MKERINLLIFLLLAGLATGQAQTSTGERSRLEKERQKLLQEIETARKLLEDTKQSRTKTLNALLTTQQQIKNRERLISNIREEIELIDDQMQETAEVVTALERDLERLKSSYAKLVQKAYINRLKHQELTYLFSAQDFNDMITRLRYLQKLSEMRRTQADLIEATRQSMENKLAHLKALRMEKETLIRQQEEQLRQLVKDKQNADRLVADLSKREESLRKDIAEKEKAAAELNKAIEEIIRKEMELARKKAEEASRKNPGNALAMTPEAKKLSAEFATNKGKLPWPVERGFISSTFGEHPHPVLKDIKIKNNGVDIQTDENAVVRAIFNGEVTSIVYNPNFQHAVIIRHGAYFTVYSNLKQVGVKRGDVVVTGQPLGTVYSEPGEKQATLHLEIWQGTTKLNPQLWLAQ